MTFDDVSYLAKTRTPFLFFCNFLGDNLHIYELEDLHKHDIEFSINENFTYYQHNVCLQKDPVSYSDYKKKFDKVIEKIKVGETYLLNLTQPTKVILPCSFQELFTIVNAPYKLRYKDEFICFSPEKFVDINNQSIFTYPMKGTINAAYPNAESTILSDPKEHAEHTMIVDLLRNDLGIVGSRISVEKFKYIDKIFAGKSSLLQVSSKISGKLHKNWENDLGQILKHLLPAGSISGTPKKRTIELIQQIENYQRNFFTGIFGYFDGNSLKSAVMIRYIEKSNNIHVYKSGGGITIDSDARKEYQEMLEKVYIP